ncbi:Acyl-CoA synthetase (AMP-forming)/AMP-acid ligase II [Sphingobium faniae]|nr:Acyl-CoA synthetase (AMP-forming)/AMP-acid ligase II [Sphingobium faniae]
MTTIAGHIANVVAIGGDVAAIDFDGATLSWKALGDGTRALSALLEQAGIGADGRIGLLGRNRLEQVGSFVAILGSGRALLLVNALRPAPLIAEEVSELTLPCLIGSRADLSPPVMESARAQGTMVVAVEAAHGALTFEVLSEIGSGPFAPRTPGTLIEIQTSGTTGKPKRIPVAEHTVASSLADGVRTAKGAVDRIELAPKASPTLMFGPLVHTSGTFNTLMSVFEVRPIVLFEKFDAEKYRQALVKYRPKFAALPPASIKMMVDSNATKEDFSSVLAARAGTAPLPVELQIAFEEKFGVPVLTTYGATEFMGVATSWTLEDHKRFGVAKRGSVGRPSKGVKLRVVDPASGEEVPVGEQGILQARIDRIDGGKEWIRTTDLARLDEDGFLYITGRADDAIIRGGFKVMAGKVSDVLLQCPGVYEAIVLGRADERLGEVPVAVVEPYPGETVDEATLKAFARERLVPYEVPARFHVVEKLPRTVSDKVSRVEVKKMLDELEG